MRLEADEGEQLAQELHSDEDMELQRYEDVVAGAGRQQMRGGWVAVLFTLALFGVAATFGHRPLTAAPRSSVVLREADAGEVKEVAGAAEEPCTLAHAHDEPSMFCWAVMFNDDKALIKSQLTGRAGIFACNDFMVIGQEEISLGTDDCGVERKSVQKDLPQVKKGHYGVDAMTSSWLNVPIFLICWDAVIESNKVWENDFTVKVDPDTVFFPGRLGYHLKEHKGKPMYTTDCRYWGGDPDGKVFGSLEVVSKQAVGAYKENKQKCKDLPWQGWGEDYWLQHCLRDAVGIPSVILADWVHDTTCPLAGNPDCSDKNFIANHPHKDAGDWWNCWKQSNGE